MVVAVAVHYTELHQQVEQVVAEQVLIIVLLQQLMEP
jgi:hypothetical protein